MDEVRKEALLLIAESNSIPERSEEKFHKAFSLLLEVGKVNQIQIAEYLKVSTRYINRLTKGRLAPRTETIMKVSEYFKILPGHFREVRLMLLKGKLIVHPELIPLFMRLVRDPKKTIEKYGHLSESQLPDGEVINV